MANNTGKKFGGRQKGTPNKVKSQTKKFLEQLIEDQQDKIKQELENLEGKAYLDAVGNLMEYSQPKLSRTEAKVEVKEEIRSIGYGDDEPEEEVKNEN